MSTKTLKSRATVAPSIKIRVVEIVNVEDILIKSLRNYFDEFKFSELYPNHKVRVGAIHPFALLLFQEVSGQDLTFDVFPSVTIADMSDTQTPLILSMDEEDIIIESDDVAILQDYIETGRIKVAPTAWTTLQNLVTTNGQASGRKRTYRKISTVNLNIWSDNRDLTVLLYDLIQQYIITIYNELHNENVQMEIESVSGTRSGDINVEFGKLLYGANLSVPVGLTMSEVSVLEDGSSFIAEIDHVAEDHIEGHVKL